MKNIKKLEKEITQEMEDELRPDFNRQARFVGNGIYMIAGLYSTDTRELFLMFVAQEKLGYVKDESGELYKPKKSWDM